MTDNVLGSEQGNGSNVSAPSQVQQAHTPSQTSDERVFRQPEVSEIVSRARHDAVEAYKRQAYQSQAPHQTALEQMGVQQIRQQPVQQYSPDDVKRMVAEETQRHADTWRQEQQRMADEHEGRRVAGEFVSKLETGRTKYQDFDKVMQGLDYTKIPYVIQLANMVDNTADVMYELRKNPEKIGALQNLIYTQPELAKEAMQKLSQSIKDNEKASQTRLPNDPLSQVRHSTTGTDNGELAVRDYKKKYRG